MNRNFQRTDSGKRVLRNDGEAVGTVVRVNDRQVYVLLDPDAVPRSDDEQTEALDFTIVRVPRRSVVQRTNRVVRLEPETDLTGGAKS